MTPQSRHHTGADADSTTTCSAFLAEGHFTAMNVEAIEISEEITAGAVGRRAGRIGARILEHQPGLPMKMCLLGRYTSSGPRPLFGPVLSSPVCRLPPPQIRRAGYTPQSMPTLILPSQRWEADLLSTTNLTYNPFRELRRREGPRSTERDPSLYPRSG